MAKVRLERIEEAANNLIMNSRISLLQESEGLDEKTRAKSELLIHESVRYIKGQLLQGGILEEAQNVLADVWTQAILEDIDLSSIGELGNKIAGGAQGLGHAVAFDTGIASGALQSGNHENLGQTVNVIDAAKNGYNQGYTNGVIDPSTTYNLGEMVGARQPIDLGNVAAGVGAGVAGLGAAGAIAAYGPKLLGKVRRAGQTK